MANLKNYESILKNENLKFISFFMKGRRKHIEYKCEKHGVLTQRFDSFIGCLKCGRENLSNHPSFKTKETVDSIAKWVNENSNAEFMGSKYKNSKTDYWFRCACGNGFITNFSEFKKGNKRQCNVCGIKTRTEYRTKDFEYYYDKVELYGKSKLKSIFRKNNKVYFNLICSNCNKSHIRQSTDYYKSPTKLCSECAFKNTAKERTLTLEYVNDYLESFNLKLLSDFKNTSTHIKIECSCGEPFKTKFNALHNSKNKVCRKCSDKIIAKKRTMPHEEFLNKFNKLNLNQYELLTKYNYSNKYMKIKHKECNRIYTIRSKSLLVSPTSCPYCKMSKGEEKISEYFKNNSIKFEVQYRFDDCRNIKPLPFDFYLIDYNILIEFDGEYHYSPRPHKIFKRYLTQRKNDLIKNKFCRENNLKLIRIPFWDYDKINKILKYLLMI